MPEPDDKTRLISLTDAAAIYGLSPTYLRTLAQKGRLKAQKVADLWLTTPQDVEVYIRSRQQRGVFRSDIQID